MQFDDGNDYFDLPSWEASEYLNKEGRRILDLLLERDGLAINANLIDQIHAHLMDRFGHTDDMDWYLASTILHGQFVEDLIPPREYTTRIYPYLNEGVAKMTEVKTFAHRVLPTEQILDEGYLIDGVFYNRDYRRGDFADLRRHLGFGSMIYVKRDLSRFGRHSYLVNIDDYAEAPHERSSDWVIQRVQEPGSFISRYTGSRASTIRVVTMRDLQGDIDSPTASLIIGGERIEFAETKPTIEVLIGKDGRLDSLGFDRDRARYRSAGNGGDDFVTGKIEHFETARQFVINLHRYLPKFDLLSWDITIDEKGVPWIYEWSGDHVDISLSQIRGGIQLLELRGFAGRGKVEDWGDDPLDMRRKIDTDPDEDGPDVVDFTQ